MSGADRGRKACYDAEDATGLYHQRRTESMTLAEAQRYVDAVLADKWVQKHFRVAKSFAVEGITVIPGRTRGFAGRRGWKPVICLGPWARQEYIVLHEIAHHLRGLSGGHDRIFCGTLVLLVARFMGHEQSETLRRSFGKFNVSASWSSMPDTPRTVSISYQGEAPMVRAAKPPTRRVVDGKTVPCAHCGTVDNVESGGSYGQPLCRRCYYRWRKTLKR